jgi:hypothetical protein
MNEVLDFVRSVAGLVSAVGTLLLGVAAVWGAKHGRPAGLAVQSRRFVATTGVILVVISAAMFSVRFLTAEDQPLNVQLTTAAWRALDAHHYDAAISSAEECVTRFQHSADRQQAELEQNRTEAPPVGAVSEQEKLVLFSRGLLNDVATCFFIKGEAAQKLGRIGAAIDAYQAASKYTYARTWDPRGWFWSPSDEARARIHRLE